MKINLALPADLQPWAKTQPDLSAAIVDVLRSHVLEGSGIATAAARLRAAIPTLPFDFEFEVPQAIGDETWSQLDRSTRLTFGKQVRRDAEAYGLCFVRKTSASHAVYKRTAS
jgi:hypothetical protein